ncbi:MAG: lytic transglycosylase domain-containing protein [Pseudolabrys sp.]
MQTPQAAIAASARLLRNLVSQFGNLGLAAAAYNAGPRRIQDWLARKGKLPEETQHYVKTITGRPAENWKAAKAASSVQNVPRQAPCQEATGLIASNEPQRADVATRSRAMLPHVKAPAYRSAGVRAVPPS